METRTTLYGGVDAVVVMSDFILRPPLADRPGIID
jgi:hypothetical protein